jgi:hypothetical protein
MISILKLTAEDVLRKSFKDDPNSISRVFNSVDDELIEVIYTTKHKIPAKYAKAILKDYINENMSQS